MFLDSSAVVEIILASPQSDYLLQRLASEPSPRFSFPTVIYEASVVLASRRTIGISDATSAVMALMQALDATIAPINQEAAHAALDAFARYGKGRHPAQLNFGDCFSYAGAKTTGVKLLYVGGDFARTDLA